MTLVIGWSRVLYIAPLVVGVYFTLKNVFMVSMKHSISGRPSIFSRILSLLRVSSGSDFSSEHNFCEKKDDY